VRGVTDLMVMPGLINLDFADIRTVMGEMGTAVVKARNTSMTATVPATRIAPSRRLWIEISITVSLVHDILPRLLCGGRELVHMLEE
jgi:cell division GTPase FtsZ